jgi:transcriptional regulator with XRE-family HTH domain
MMPTIEAVKINGERLRELRRERFLTRGELAEESGVARDHIGRLERGEIPGESRMGTIRKLAAALKVDPAELVRGE